MVLTAVVSQEEALIRELNASLILTKLNFDEQLEQKRLEIQQFQEIRMEMRPNHGGPPNHKFNNRGISKICLGSMVANSEDKKSNTVPPMTDHCLSYVCLSKEEIAMYGSALLLVLLFLLICLVDGIRICISQPCHFKSEVNQSARNEELIELEYTFMEEGVQSLGEEVSDDFQLLSEIEVSEGLLCEEGQLLEENEN